MDPQARVPVGPRDRRPLKSAATDVEMRGDDEWMIRTGIVAKSILTNGSNYKNVYFKIFFMPKENIHLLR